MSEFVDITLLECNRKNSVNAETNSDNSLYTNRMGQGVNLKVGDTIQIDAAFINQRGAADASSIEFKGKKIGEAVFNELQGQRLYDPDMAESMNGLFFNYRTIEETPKDIIDNEMWLETEYYNTNNGEGYMYLPRNFWGTNFHSTYTNLKTAKEVWTSPDRNKDTQGVTYTKGSKSGICLYAPDYVDMPEMWNGFYNKNDYHIVQDVNSATSGAHMIRPISDNSRFTLFSRDFYFKTYDANEATIDGVVVQDTAWWKDAASTLPNSIRKYSMAPSGANYGYDPALTIYSRHVDLNKLSVDKGFNTPTAIAEQLTEQLQEQTDDSPMNFSIDDTTTKQEQVLTYPIKTKFFKPVDAANISQFSKANYDLFFSDDAVDRDKQGAVDYQSSTNNIYVKRPEIFESGRKVNNWWGNVDQYLGVDNATRYDASEYLLEQVMIHKVRGLVQVIIFRMHYQLMPH